MRGRKIISALNKCGSAESLTESALFLLPDHLSHFICSQRKPFHERAMWLGCGRDFKRY